MSSLRTKIFIQFFVTNGATLASFCLSVYIARLLSPSEIGIFSIAAVLVGFGHVFRDFGVVSFIRSQKTLTPELLRASMGVMMCASWTFALIVFFASSYAAEYYNQPGIRSAMRVLAIGFIFIPFGSIPQAVLGRSLDVKIQAIVTAVSVTFYAGTCIVLAKMGFSYMAFAWANLVNIMVSAITYSLLRPSGIPWLPSLVGWRHVVNFGAGTMLTNSIRAVDTALPDLILGKLSSAHFVGLFSRANSTVNVLNYVASPTINFVTLPYLAKIHHSGNNISVEVRRAIVYLTGMMWPALAVIAIIPEDIITLLYGKNWIECAVVIPSLCIVGAIQLTFSVLQPAFTSMGRPYLVALPLLISVLAKAILTITIFDGTFQSFANAYLIGELFSVPVYFFLVRKVMRLSLRDWLMAIWPSGLLAVIVYAIIYMAYRQITYLDHVLLRLFVTGVLYFTVWISVIILIRHPLLDELSRARRSFIDRFILKARSQPPASGESANGS